MQHILKTIVEKIRGFFSSNFTSLLLSLILLFVFRPYDQSHYYHGIWKLLLAIAILSAVFNCGHNRTVKIAATVLAIPSVLFNWLNLFFPSALVVLPIAIVTIPFLVLCTGSILYDVVLRAKVTLETLRGVICAYFMVAFAFAYIYWIIEYLNPGAFLLPNDPDAFTGNPNDVVLYAHHISRMLYFSFITLLTIGYGDIVAIKENAQTFCVLEGIIGQFYVAILVSRLVAIYSFYSDERLLRALEKDIGSTKTQHGPESGGMG